MKSIFLLPAALLTALHAFAAEKPMQERVRDFTAKYDTEEKITQRLAELTQAEPNNPDPYILAANAYLKTSSQIHLNAGKNAPGFATLVDPKTKKQVGAISQGPDAQSIQLALATLTTAAGKFPQRLDIHVGRMSVAQTGDDTAGVLAAGVDLVKAAQSEGDKMRWLDGAPLPEPLKEKVPHELQGRIGWLYHKETDDTDLAAYQLSLEGLKIAPENVVLLNYAAAFHSYKEQWDKAKPYLERAEKADPTDLFVKHNLARVYGELGEKKLARDKWLEIIKLSPGSEEAKAAQKSIDQLGASKKKK